MARAEQQRQVGAMRRPSAKAGRANTHPEKLPLTARIKRWLTQALVLGGVAVVVLGAGRGGLYLLDLKVERISISGSARNVSTERVESLVAPRIAHGFLAADIDDIKAQLEAMPWVYTANTRRRWPDTLVIQIEEQRPIARWGMDGFLNHQGDFFAGDMSSQWAALPRLEGPEGSQNDLVAHYKTLESLLEGLDVAIVWLAQDEVGQLSAELDNGTLLVLGSDALVERTQRFVKLHQQHLNGEAVVRIDLRYEYGAAVQLMEPQVAMHETTLEELR